MPPDTELTPRPDLFPAWDSLTDTQRRLYVRQMEVYAGYQENADWNVGRLLDAIEAPAGDEGAGRPDEEGAVWSRYRG